MVNFGTVGLRASVPGLVSLFFVLCAYFYKKSSDESLREQLDRVLNALLKAENKPLKEKPVESGPKVAVGFGGCLDLFVDSMDLFEKVKAEAPSEPDHFPHIKNQAELEKMFAYFFRHGAASERYVFNKTLFEELVKAAYEVPDSRVAIGGNAPVMGARMQREGCSVLLGAQVSTKFMNLLKTDLKVAGGMVNEDDIHLILEYKTNDKWGQYTSPRANRFIVHSDMNNPNINSLENFVEEIKSFSPSLLVIGGLQMLDHFPFAPGKRAERLDKVKELMASMPMSKRIHFEMASFADEETLRDVVDKVVYYADSLGMNEQELPNLHSMLTNGSVTLISDPYPRVATVLDHMRAVYSILGNVEERDGRRKLTRLHVHTLAYQAILTTKNSPWKNTMSAAAKASLTANRHVCGSNSIKTEKARIIMDDSFSTSREAGSSRIPFHPERPVSCWEEQDFEICLAPNLVCTEVVQTAGGGDNISAAGLVLQI